MAKEDELLQDVDVLITRFGDQAILCNIRAELRQSIENSIIANLAAAFEERNGIFIHSVTDMIHGTTYDGKFLDEHGNGCLTDWARKHPRQVKSIHFSFPGMEVTVSIDHILSVKNDIVDLDF